MRRLYTNKNIVDIVNNGISSGDIHLNFYYISFSGGLAFLYVTDAEIENQTDLLHDMQEKGYTATNKIAASGCSMSWSYIDGVGYAPNIKCYNGLWYTGNQFVSGCSKTSVMSVTEGGQVYAPDGTRSIVTIVTDPKIVKININ